MRSSVLAFIVLFPASATWAACSSSTPDAPSQDLPFVDGGTWGLLPDGAIALPDGASALPDAGGGPITPAAVCDAYIACVAATTPAGLGVVAEAYGRDGTCWKTLSADTCRGACKTGIVQTHRAYPKEEACDLCDTSADCPSQLPSCDTVSRKCFECGADADCAGKTNKACDTTKRICVECMQAADCQDPNRPACDPATNRCVMCATNQDCQGGFGGICDAATKQCRGCNGDAECTGAAPKCDPAGRCVGCVDGSTCPSGACGMSGACCDPNTCAKNGVQCGFTIDLLGCGLFTEIPCGACPGAQNCVHSACKDPPANHCGAGCGGRCGYVPESNSYECVNVSSSCNSKSNIPCSAGFECTSRKDPITGTYYDVCVDYCLTNADCKVGTCSSLSGVKGLGTCQ